RAFQDARVYAALGRDRTRTLWRGGCEIPPVPLWRTGQFAWADRAAGRKKRLSHPARNPRCEANEACTRPGRAIAGMERGARLAPSMGSAMVAAFAAGARLRNGPARIRRHLRRRQGDRSESAPIVG